MDKALLDTDIFSEVLKGKDSQIAARAVEYSTQFGRLVISTITVMEIVKGFHRAGKAGHLARFEHTLNSVDIFALDVDAAIIAGQIYAGLERTGQPLGRVDPMIAAIAIRENRILITGNTDHYERIKGLGYPLHLDNWRAKAQGDP